MRKTIIAVAMAVGLSGCAGTLPPVNDDVATIVAQVRAIAATTCSFLPTAATIANIFFSGNPALQSAETIAAAICASLVPPPMAFRGKGPYVPRVNGVVVRGRRV